MKANNEERADEVGTHKSGLSRAPVPSISTVAIARDLQAPAISRSLTKLPPLRRSAEVLRVLLLRLEYWLSPTGRLRGFLRLVVLISFWLGAVCLCVAPLVGSFLAQLTTWSSMIVTLVNNMAAIPMGLGKVVLGAAAIAIALRLLFRR